MKKILGFSLVELMISLIVISIVTAAFAPVVTKKLKTSDQSIGTATAVSITSSAVCNSVSKGCIECENDKCLAPADGYFLNESTGKSQHCNTTITGCAQCTDSSTCTKSEDGYYFDGANPVKCPDSCSTCTSGSVCTGCKSAYWLNSSSCTACSVQNAACQTCSNGSTCTKCADNYMLSNGKCVKCPNHCKTCSSSSVCTTCDNSYFLTANNVCFKYTCDGILCFLTKNDDKVLSMYRYNLGDGGYAIPAGINTCSVGQSNCGHGYATPICWKVNPVDSAGYSSRITTCTAKDVHYSGCDRTTCNWYAAQVAQNAYKTGGWHLANQTDIVSLKSLDYRIGRVGYADETGPFCTYAVSYYNMPSCVWSFGCNTVAGGVRGCEPAYYWSSFQVSGSHGIFYLGNSAAAVFDHTENWLWQGGVSSAAVVLFK